MNDDAQLPQSDDFTRPLDEAEQQLGGAVDNVEQTADAMTQKLNDGLDGVQQKAEEFFSGFDNFLSKF